MEKYKYSLSAPKVKESVKPVGKKPVVKKLKETQELDWITKYLYRDLMKNHHISKGGKAKMIVDSVVEFYTKLVEEHAASTGQIKQLDKRISRFL